MSLPVQTTFQIVQIFILYSLMTVVIPAMIFRRKLAKYKLTIRFLSYLTIGNFYLMNIVFILQLLHISNKFTLIVFYFIPAVIAGVIINRFPLKSNVMQVFSYFLKLLAGYIGMRTFLSVFFQWLKDKLVRAVQCITKHFRQDILGWLLIIGITAFLVYIYGYTQYFSYGYYYSDLPVHNYWINELSNNNIFAAGIYPFGFHCIIYYLHTVFNIETFVLLRLFGLVQTIYIYTVLFAFIKAICKTRYAAYLGYGSYVLIRVFSSYCTERYHSALPQEFGMIFILPSILFAFEFFKLRNQELKQKQKTTFLQRRALKKEKRAYYKTLTLKKKIFEFRESINYSTHFLWGFAMCFSMTLAVHFYDTMIAGIFCAAIAIGFMIRFLNPRYFGRVLATFLASMMIAILPMAIAFSMGKPLQGSLKWGMNVMSSAKTTSTPDTSDNSQGSTGLNTNPDAYVNNPNYNSNISTDVITDNEKETDISTDKEKISVWDRVISKVTLMSNKLESTLRNAVYISRDAFRIYAIGQNLPEGNTYFFLLLGAIAGIIVLAVIGFIIKQRDYAGVILSSALYMGMLLILLGAKGLGLPQLMDANRSRIYVAYSIPIVVSLLLDAFVYLLFIKCRKTWVVSTVSLLGCTALGTVFIYNRDIQKPLIMTALETNGAIECTTNIINDKKKDTWTIVSANDELRMSEEYGYHFETISFLNAMENKRKNGSITIPTHFVFFYIEKVPLDYNTPYAGSGQSVSQAGASRALPKGSGISAYVGENRWITMSRMYYWAQKFKTLYPNEFKVYYEDDKFVCYYIEQNEYSLYDFAIDYGYNNNNY